MQSFIFFTPASISFLTQFILALAVTGFLLSRLHHQPSLQLGQLCGFFGLTTTFIGLMFLDVTLSPDNRLLVVYAENTVLALALVFLIQFAYRFPQKFTQHKWEARITLVISLVYFLWEMGYMIYRYALLFGQGQVVFRPFLAAYWMAFVLLLAPFAFIRQSIAADPRSVNWLRKLWKPEGEAARGARAFVIVFSIPFILGLFNVLLIFRLPHTVYNAALSIGILMALWLFATNYINFIPGGVSVQTRLSILTLTLFLALLGTVGWLVAPPYIATFQPDLQDHQTLRFTPNAAGSYDISEVDFHFETDLGQRISLGIREDTRSRGIEFPFPFFDQTFTHVFVANTGTITFDEPFWHPNMQAATSHLPTIFPLMLDLDPDPNSPSDGGIYYRVEPDRLILTWNQLPALYRTDKIFTFQSVLYSNGVFEITYNGLPLPLTFNLDANPSADPWMRGAVSGRGEPLHTNIHNILLTAQTGGYPLLENYQLAFRHYLHEFMLPLAEIVIGGSLLLMLAIPILLRSSIVRPLKLLAVVVRQFEDGSLETSIPIQNEDEIGYLTQVFNTMAARINELITTLEDRVAQRTFELSAANKSLRAEMEAREAAQAQVLIQSKALAALEEREQISRDLHDGLGQFVAYLGVQLQATQDLLARGETEAVTASLERMEQFSQETQLEIRHFILGLRQDDKDHTGLMSSLENYLIEFRNITGIEVQTFWPEDNDCPTLPGIVEEQVIHIIQEALTNIRKHASAQNVELLVTCDARNLQFVISDNGVGFDLQQRQDNGQEHFGLVMMCERAQKVGGKLEVRSTPRKGTKIILQVPVLITTAAEAGDTNKTWQDLRILIADDSAIFTEGLTNLLATRGFVVVGSARDGIDAQAKNRGLRPDIIVMDLMMPRCDGVEATKAIKAEFPEVKILVLTASEKEEHLVTAIRNGASGYLLKNMDANEFCAQLSNLARGETILPPGIAAQVIRGWNLELYSDNFSTESLSDRQQEIVTLIARGLTYKEIGVRLHLSERTIKYHVGRIMETLELQNRTQLIAFANRPLKV